MAEKTIKKRTLDHCCQLLASLQLAIACAPMLHPRTTFAFVDWCNLEAPQTSEVLESTASLSAANLMKRGPSIPTAMSIRAACGHAR